MADEVTNEGFRAPVAARAAAAQPAEDPRADPRAGVTYERVPRHGRGDRPFDMPLAPIYGEPIDIDGLDGDWPYDPNMQVVFSNGETARGKKYAFDYVRSDYTAEALRTAPAAGRGQRRGGALHPGAGRAPR